MQKLFVNPLADPTKIYNDLLNVKYNSNKFSLTRYTCFEKTNFNFKINEESKKDTITTFQEELALKLDLLNRNTLKYIQWTINNIFQKINVTQGLNIDERAISDILKKSNFSIKDFEHVSYGSHLFLLCLEIIKSYRQSFSLSKNNYGNMNTDEINNFFDNFNDNLEHAYNKEEQLVESNNEFVMSGELNKLNEEFVNNSELSSAFNLIVDEKDLILKSCIRNKLELADIAEKEKALFLFRQFPGIGRYLMPELPLKEEFYRKARKCDIYPFLDVGIPLYEKYEIIKKFEETFKEKISEQNFNFSNRKYQEFMNTNLLAQTLNNSLLFDQETLIQYNERDDNLLFSSYFRCPKGRIYRKNSKYRYMSKPDFENWKKTILPRIEPQKAAVPKEIIQPQLEVKDVKKEEIKKEDPKKDEKKQANQSIPQNNVTSQLKTEPNVVAAETIPFSSKITKIVDEYKHDLLYEADDLNVGEIIDKTKYMFPSDNGVIIKKYIKNGIYYSTTNYTLKDNLIFSL